MTVSPTFGIAGITQFNFASSASDPDGDVLTYTSDFADGSTRTGVAVAYNYGNVTGTWSANGGGVPVTGVLDPAAANRIDGNANFVIRLKITGGGGPGGFSDYTI